MSITSELLTFLSFFACGAGLGILFDFFRAFRKFFNLGTLAVAVTDGLFWILGTALGSYCVFYINGGLLCFFVTVGFFLGIILYFLSVSRPVFTLFFKIITIISNFFHLFLKILLTPIRFSYRIILVYFFRQKKKFNSGVQK